MRDLLPSRVFEALQDRYLAGVASAEAHYDQHSADEDSVTGALGEALAAREPMVFRGPAGQYTVNVTYRKVRGRGRGAPEKIFGADGIFQIEIADASGRQIRAKGLPFQAKKGWKGKDRQLLDQAKRMELHVPGGVIIDYSNEGYRACSAQAAVAANGSRPQVDRFGVMKRLGQVLSTDFLECTIGKVGLFYDNGSERFGAFPDSEQPLEVITTTIRQSE
jgi:hypothetical protein